jgi:hypothetical protein
LKLGLFNIEIDFIRLSLKFVLIEVFASVPPDPVLVVRGQHRVRSNQRRGKQHGGK